MSGGHASLITPKYYRSIRYINLKLARPIPIPALISWPLSFHAACSCPLSFPAQPGSPSKESCGMGVGYWIGLLQPVQVPNQLAPYG